MGKDELVHRLRHPEGHMNENMAAMALAADVIERLHEVVASQGTQMAELKATADKFGAYPSVTAPPAQEESNG